jgi:hypothetical protein
MPSNPLFTNHRTILRYRVWDRQCRRRSRICAVYGAGRNKNIYFPPKRSGRKCVGCPAASQGRDVDPPCVPSACNLLRGMRCSEFPQLGGGGHGK